MGVRRALVTTAAFLLPAAAYAGHHNFSASAGVSLTDNQSADTSTGSVWNGGLSTRQAQSFDNGWGGHVAAEATVFPELFNEDLSIVADASVHGVGANKTWDATQVTVLVGPRVALPSIQGIGHIFVHAMFGAIHRSDGLLQSSISAGAVAIGVGADITFRRETTTRGYREAGKHGARIQFDRIFAATGIEDTWRSSIAYVYRFN